MMNLSLHCNLQFMTQKLIDRKFGILQIITQNGLTLCSNIRIFT